MLYNNKLWKEKVFQLYSLPSLFPYIYFSNSNSIKWTSRLFVHLFVSCRFVSSSHPLIVSTVIYLIKLFFVLSFLFPLLLYYDEYLQFYCHLFISRVPCDIIIIVHLIDVLFFFFTLYLIVPHWSLTLYLYSYFNDSIPSWAQQFFTWLNKNDYCWRYKIILL